MGHQDPAADIPLNAQGRVDIAALNRLAATDLANGVAPPRENNNGAAVDVLARMK